MKKEYITIADVIAILNTVENPTETFIGIPQRNGYGEIFYSPTTHISIETSDWYEDLLHHPNPYKIITLK